MMNPRAVAATLLFQTIINKRSLSTIFAKHTFQKEGSLVKELCYGTLRWYYQLDFIAKQFISKPFKVKDQDVYLLILIGLYQLIHLNIAKHAVVTETVAAARLLQKDWATKIINAVLRQFLREQTQILTTIKEDESAHYAHPSWLINEIKKYWLTEWKRILEVNNQRPPFTLRINTNKISINTYLSELTAKNIHATDVPDSPSAIILSKAIEVNLLPYFSEGWVSVQDKSAQLAAPLLDLYPHHRVLDACAAPGGKTTHILELQPEIEVVAIDIDRERLQKVQENLQRLQFNATLIVGDATNPKTWWDGKLFDRILLDAPCSATGVIRRHPDIKLLRQATDIKALAAQQYKLLKNLWPLLKSGGILVYCTCSILPEENLQIIGKFLQSQDDAKEIPINIPGLVSSSLGKQLLPTATADGFYYAKLYKKFPN